MAVFAGRSGIGANFQRLVFVGGWSRMFREEERGKKEEGIRYMLREIGLRRLCKYLVFGLWDEIFRLLPWSPVRILWMKLFGAKAAWSAVVEKVHFMNL